MTDPCQPDTTGWKNLVVDYGAVGDMQVVNAIVSIAGTAISSTSNLWVVGDVGKYIAIQGLVSDGDTTTYLDTFITGFTDAQHITVSVAGTTLTSVSKTVMWGTDCTPALELWLTYGIGQGTTPVFLYIPPGGYYFGSNGAHGRGGLANNIYNASISGWGATLNGVYFSSSGLVQNGLIAQDFTHSARVQAISVGATSATLINAGDASIFSIGQWVIVTGFATQGPDSYPPNFQFFEYRKITNKVGSVISWTDPLVNEYKTTWPAIDEYTVTIDIPTSTLTFVGGGPSTVEGQNTWLTTTGALPTPLVVGNRYNKKNLSGTSFQLSTTSGGSPITLSGTQSGTHKAHAQGMDLAGPATLFTLDPVFDGAKNYYGFTVANAGESFFGGRTIFLCGVTFKGLGPAPSVSTSITIRRCDTGYQNEIDKLVDYLEYDQCFSTVGARQLLVFSGSINLLAIKDSVFGSLNGTPRRCTIDRTTLDDARALIAGADAFGHTDSIVITNSNIVGSELTGHAVPSSVLSSYSAGTFTVTNVSAYNNNVWGIFTPGGHYLFAYSPGGVIFTVNDSSQKTYFKVLDVRQDATNTYIDTDIVGALPTPTFNGGNPVNTYLAAVELITEQCVTGPDATQFAFVGITYACTRWTVYNKAKKNLFNGTLLNTSSFRLSLFTSASNAATATLSTYGSITGEVTSIAGSYSSSGKPLTGVTWTAGVSAGIMRFNSTEVFFSAATQLNNIKYAVIWATGASAKARKLLCRSQLSASQFNVRAGDRLTLLPDANGWFQLQ